MKEVTLRIPDNKFKFFMELIKQLGFEIQTEKDAREEDYEIPEEHKAIVRERMKRYQEDPSSAKNWDDIKDSFNLDE